MLRATQHKCYGKHSSDEYNSALPKLLPRTAGSLWTTLSTCFCLYSDTTNGAWNHYCVYTLYIRYGIYSI